MADCVSQVSTFTNVHMKKLGAGHGVTLKKLGPCAFDDKASTGGAVEGVSEIKPPATTAASSKTRQDDDTEVESSDDTNSTTDDEQGAAADDDNAAKAADDVAVAESVPVGEPRSSSRNRVVKSSIALVREVYPSDEDTTSSEDDSSTETSSTSSSSSSSSTSSSSI